MNLEALEKRINALETEQGRYDALLVKSTANMDKMIEVAQTTTGIIIKCEERIVASEKRINALFELLVEGS